ncbi:hypothetical protein [Planctomycetes bacterium SV_7m_r]|uniref:hypothetical protein n=1 Tax=Stieleria bergensis TaxID=2528025 RepID=UPI0011A5FCF0
MNTASLNQPAPPSEKKREFPVGITPRDGFSDGAWSGWIGRALAGWSSWLVKLAAKNNNRFGRSPTIENRCPALPAHCGAGES